VFTFLNRIKLILPGPFELPILGGAIPILMAAGVRGQHYEKLHRVSKKYGHTITVKVGDINGGICELGIVILTV